MDPIVLGIKLQVIVAVPGAANQVAQVLAPLEFNISSLSLEAFETAHDMVHDELGKVARSNL